MGVYENQPAQRTGMHWPQPERQQPCVQHAYDPSRDLSPNLPHHMHPDLQDTRLPCAPCAPCAPCDRLDPFNNNNNEASVGVMAAGAGDDEQGCHQCSHHTQQQVVLPPSSSSSSSSGSSTCSSTASFPPSSTPLLRPKQERPCSPGGPLGTTTTTDLEAAGPCAGCGQRISDRFYLLAVDRRWHAACLQCCSCRHALDGEVTCFSKDGNIYCKKDYYRLFGMKRCARCHAAISSSELVMRARELVFHVACFTCAACSAPLAKGDHFGLREGAVLCRLHYELPASPTPAGPTGPAGPAAFPAADAFAPVGPAFRGAVVPPSGMSPLAPLSALPPATMMHGPMPGGPGGPMPVHHHDTTKLPFFNGGVPQVVPTGARQKGRPRKRKPKEMEGITAAMGDMGGDSYLDGPFGPGTPGLHGNSRSKRMRTSFKHHQLRTMKSYFAINHNPDAKDLKQLSQKTGLPKRVLQVWFQNARAKWRRLMLKQEGKGGDKCDSPGDLEYAGPLGSGPGGPHSPQFILGGSPLEC